MKKAFALLGSVMFLVLGVAGNAYAQDRYSVYNSFLLHNESDGHYVLSNNTTGSHNSAYGFGVLNQNTEGSYNAGLGVYSLEENTTGSENSAFGSFSLENNTTGDQNTAAGSYSMNSNTTGSRNTASGFKSLMDNTTGERNTAAGSYSLKGNTTGNDNTASGYDSLTGNTTGYGNTASGSNALKANTTGANNTSVGYGSLTSNTTGENNVALGKNAGYSTTGSGNVFIGTNAGYNETGSNKLYIANSSTSSPLLLGDFSASTLDVNGDLRVTGDLLVNGTNVMDSIGNLGDGVKATTALNAAFAAVPSFSGDSKFECGMGTGAYGDKYAIAGSCGVALTEAVSFNAGGSVLPSGSESYGVGSLPSYALKAGFSVKFGPSIKRQSIAALSQSGNEGFNRLALSDARNEADNAKLVATAALDRAASLETIALANKAKAEAATQELNKLRQQVAALEAYKEKVDVIFAALQTNNGNLNLASYKH